MEMVVEERTKECWAAMKTIQDMLEEEKRNAQEVREVVDYQLMTLLLQLTILGKIARLPTFLVLPGI